LEVDLEKLSEDGKQLINMLSREVRRLGEETKKERGGFSLKRMVGVLV